MTDVTTDAAELRKLGNDVSEIKGMLSATLSAQTERIQRIEAMQEDSREVHARLDTAIAQHGSRLSVVENTSMRNAARLEKAGDQSRATVALVVSALVGLAGVASFALSALDALGVPK